MKRIQISLKSYNNGWPFIHSGNLAKEFKENISLNLDSDCLRFDSVDFTIPHRLSTTLEFTKDYSNRVRKIIFINCSFSSPHQELLERNFINNNHHPFITLINCNLDTLRWQNYQSIHIENCTIKNIELDNNRKVTFIKNNSEYLKLHHSRVTKPLNLSGNKLSVVWLSDIQTEDDLTFEKLNATIRLRNIQSENASISITGCQPQQDSYLDKVKAKNCSIRDCNEGGLKLSSIEFETLKVYRNRCWFTIENSTLSDSKFNLNREGDLSIKNVSIQSELILDKNQVEQTNLEKVDVSKLSFTGNEGNLSVINGTGDDFPDLTKNSFQSIAVSDINQEDESWNINLESCSQLSLISIYTDTLLVQADHIEELNIETSIGDLGLKANKVGNFKLSHHKAHNSSQIQIKESDAIEITELISPVLDTQLGTNNTFLIKESEVQLYFNANQCNRFSALTVTKGQGSILEIGKSEQLEFESFEAEALKISGQEFNDIQISKSSTPLDLNITRANNLSIDGHKRGVETVLNIDSAKRVKIASSDFQKIDLKVNQSELIEFSEVKSEKLLSIQKSSSQIVTISNTISSHLRFTEMNTEEFDLSAEEAEKNQKITRCEFLNSNFDSSTIHNYDFVQLNLENFTSEKLELLTSNYENILIKDCSPSWVGIGEETRDDSQMGWFFEAIPERKLEVQDSKIIDSFRFNDASKPNTDDPFLSVQVPELLLNSSNFGSLTISKFKLDKIASETCKFGQLDIIENIPSKQKPRISFSGDEIVNLKIERVDGSLAISDSNIQDVKISESPFQSITIGKCESTTKGYSIETIELKKSHIQKINISDSSIADLSISEAQPTEMKLRNLKLKNLSFHDFEKHKGSSSKFELRSINNGTGIKAETFEVLESDLTGLSFNSCYFNTFKKLSIKESKLDEIKCTATTWPTSVTSEEGKDKQFEIREACRQLKLAMAGHQDKVSELQFHSLEMNAYRKIVRSRGLHPRNWNDRLSLFAGSSNKFGMNWFLPLGLIVLFTFVHYLFILWSHHSMHPFQKGFWSFFISKDFFLLFNPTHRFSNLSLGTTNWGWTAFWDFSSKIWSAFFLYQLVAAFRKFRRN